MRYSVTLFKTICLLLILAATMSSCSLVRSLSQREQIEERARSERATSQRDALISSTLLIEATRQKLTGNMDQAVVMFYEATVRDPNNDAAFFELAKLHAMQNQKEDAIVFANRAVAIDPKNIYYQTLLAELYLFSNNPSKAIAVFQELSRMHPTRMGVKMALAETLTREGRVDEALAVYRQMQQNVGVNEEISLRIQRLLVENGRLDEAIIEAEALVKAFPDEPFFTEILGDLYQETGQNAKAKVLFDSMLLEDPENPYALLMIADYYHRQGDPNQSIEFMKKAFYSERLDKDSRIRMLYTLYHLSAEDTIYLQPALYLCEQLIVLQPDDPEPYLIFGDFLFREHRYEEARIQYRFGTEKDPQRMQAWHQLLVVNNILRDWQSMLVYSDKALEFFIDQPVLFLFNGLANFQLNNYQEAASALEFGLDLLEPESNLKLSFYELLGSAYHHLREFAKSDSAYNRALRIDPQNSTILNNFAYHLAVRNIRLSEAETMALEANRLRPGIPAYQDTLGWIYFRQGRFLEAKEWIGKAVLGSETPSAVILEQYGNVLYKLNNIDEAVKYWIKAKETGEGSELLHQKIRDRRFYEKP